MRPKPVPAALSTIVEAVSSNAGFGPKWGGKRPQKVVSNKEPSITRGRPLDLGLLIRTGGGGPLDVTSQKPGCP